MDVKPRDTKGRLDGYLLKDIPVEVHRCGSHRVAHCSPEELEAESQRHHTLVFTAVAFQQRKQGSHRVSLGGQKDKENVVCTHSGTLVGLKKAILP